MEDVIVVGGGVIGLSIAVELAGQGVAVAVIEQGDFGREASWAGAGILPPGNLDAARTPEAQLRSLSHSLWSDWAESLEAETGIDPGYSRCGGLELRLGTDSDELADENPHLAKRRGPGRGTLARRGPAARTATLSRTDGRLPPARTGPSAKSATAQGTHRGLCGAGRSHVARNAGDRFRRERRGDRRPPHAERHLSCRSVLRGGGRLVADHSAVVGRSASPCNPCGAKSCWSRRFRGSSHTCCNLAPAISCRGPTGRCLIGATEEHVGFVKCEHGRRW